MAINIVSLITQFITPDITARIADALGMDRSKANTAIGAAVPGLLSGLAATAAQPGGAQRIADAVDQNNGIFDSITSVLGGGNHGSLMSAGSQLMSSLFGSRDGGALGDAVSRYAGLNTTQSSSLLSMLTPLVMGGIGQALGRGQLNASGISSFFASQKDNIMSALPSSFKSLLSSTGLFNGYSSTTRTAQTAGGRVGSMAGDGMRTAASTSHRFGTSADRSSDRAIRGYDNWLYWLIPLLALSALALWLFSNNANRTDIRRASSVPAVMLGTEDVSANVSSNIADLHRALADVNNPMTSATVVPRLRVINENLGRITNRLNELSFTQRRDLAKLVNPQLATVHKEMNDALATPGAAPEMRPTIDELRAKLVTLSD